jgi:hypothetical protein
VGGEAWAQRRDVAAKLALKKAKTKSEIRRAGFMKTLSLDRKASSGLRRKSGVVEPSLCREKRSGIEIKVRLVGSKMRQ